MDALWSKADVILCITLSTRPERRSQAEEAFKIVGLSHRVEFFVREPDVENGMRGCFESHRAAAQHALGMGAQRALIFEDDVEFLPTFTAYAASRARRFLDREDWDIFFLGHFAQAMELTDQPDVVHVRSMDAHAYFLSVSGMTGLAGVQYSGEQIDVHFHYRNCRAFALYPMAAVQRAGFSDTEREMRPSDWNQDKLERERRLYDGCVRRSALARAEALVTPCTASSSSSGSQSAAVVKKSLD
mmetsp:Transcript_6986/g.21438  ORF Transcript_6986/g.21438 Transcript_6986/m.21438 type:complete len:244 (-) Transcript_6986:104-835(-)